MAWYDCLRSKNSLAEDLAERNVSSFEESNPNEPLMSDDDFNAEVLAAKDQILHHHSKDQIIDLIDQYRRDGKR